MNGQTTRRSSAFTLVELLVVIGIIAVLIAILLPALSRAKQQANATACLSNMRQMGQALVMFANEHNGYLPKAWFNNRPNTTTAQPDRSVLPSEYAASDSWGYRYPMYGWDYVLLKYVKGSKAVYQCPSDSDPAIRGLWNNSQSNLPDAPEADDLAASYRLNVSNQPNQALNAVKLTQLKPASKAILIVEGPSGTGATIHHVATWESGEPGGSVGPKTNKNVAFNRHVRKANYAFADGHAEPLQWEETWKPIGPRLVPGTSPFWREQTMWRLRYDIPAGRTTPHTDATQ